MARRGLTGMNTSVHTIVAHYFLNHGTEEQRSSFLPRMARGELIGAIAMTEPGTGSDLQGIHTRADKCGDVYRLSGSKTFISNGFLAGVILVVAKTDPHRGAKGTSILIVETRDCLGFRVGRLLDKYASKRRIRPSCSSNRSMCRQIESSARWRVGDSRSSWPICRRNGPSLV